MKRTGILITSLLAGACGLVDDPAPDRARVIIEGEAGKQVRVILSKEFVAAVNEARQTRVVIFQADTVLTTLPYETVYEIADEQRFFVEAARLETDLQTVRVQVYLDNNREFDQGGALIADHPYRFVYTFNQAITQEIVVL